MVDIVDDTEVININVTYPEGIADITNVSYPANVTAGQPFDITYQVTNTGSWSDTLWGCLFENGVAIPDSSWTEIVAAGATISKTITMTLSAPFNGELRAGHIE